MNRNGNAPPFEPPVFTRDTLVEVTSTGAIDPQLNAPQRRQDKLGSVLETAAQGVCKTAFDPAQRSTFFEHVNTVEAVGDAVLGATDTVEETSLPYCAEKVVPAGAALLKHRELVSELCPPVAGGVRWASLAAALDFAKLIEEREEDLERRRENLAIVKAHVLTFIDDTVTRAADVADSTIKHHRGLRLGLRPVTDLISGAAEQGQQTRRIVARALKRQAQKTPALTVVKDAAPAAAAGPAAPATPAAPHKA